MQRKKRKLKRTLVSKRSKILTNRLLSRPIEKTLDVDLLFLCDLLTADAERMNQLSRRQVRVTKQHNEEVRELLRLMGIPCVVVSIRSIPEISRDF